MQWTTRAEAVISVLTEIDADIVAFQEMETFSGTSIPTENRQLETVRAAFPRYGVGAFRQDARTFPSTQPILFRTDRFTLVDDGFFSFSPTPTIPYSRPWHRGFPSFGSWTRLYDRESSGMFLVINVHIENGDPRNRAKSTDLLVEMVNALQRPDDRVIVLGDFNALRWMRVPRTIAREISLTIAPTDGATFHFYRGWRLFPAIDHVLYGAGLEWITTTTWRQRPHGAWPSDHFPVSVDLRIR
jgi:endonuclease/exonuclease/phosphatase family metal-dependent hydrolase